MYAVIESGGKQYRVSEGQTLKLETINAEPGAMINFDKVLMIANGDAITVGSPYVDHKVTATVVEHGRHKKVRIIKFRRRKHYMKRMGHRQNFTTVHIHKIGG